MAFFALTLFFACEKGEDFTSVDLESVEVQEVLSEEEGASFKTLEAQIKPEGSCLGDSPLGLAMDWNAATQKLTLNMVISANEVVTENENQLIKPAASMKISSSVFNTTIDSPTGVIQIIPEVEYSVLCTLGDMVREGCFTISGKIKDKGTYINNDVIQLGDIWNSDNSKIHTCDKVSLVLCEEGMYWKFVSGGGPGGSPIHAIMVL